MANYLGNASLSPAVKDRVLSTFQQTLALYNQGRMDEVVQGCGLILRMDPMFDPAKKLMEKARNPNAPVDVEALAAAAGGAADIDPMREAREAMSVRDFQRVVNITTEVLTNDILNDEARVLNEQAREKMEASPFVDQFARKFDQQLAARNMQAAKSELEKARALDPDHPSVARMQSALAAATPAPAPPPPPQQQQQQPGAFSFDATPPSFVVDTPSPASSRPAAQAADFGFTFEEDKSEPAGGGFGSFSFGTQSAPANDPFASFQPQPSTPPPSPAPAADGGFSFDTPSASPASGGFGASTFDFSTASVETSTEDQKKIAQYLSEGDRAFDGGDFQKAIDLWSRIFLIDVTNDDASQRIEKAKTKRREIEQRVETMVGAAVATFDKRDYPGARAQFEEILRLDPANQTAQEYLDRIGQGGAAAAPAFEPSIPPTPARDIFDDDLMGGEPPLVPPDPGAVAAIPEPAPKKKAAVAKAPGARRGMSINFIIGVAVAVLVAAGSWFAWSKFMAKPAYDPAATRAVLKQANSLAAQGKFDQAIAMLQDVKPDDPQHDRALVMIADLQKRKSQAAEMVDGRPAAVVYQENLANGKQAFEAHDYDAAKKAFDAATRIKPLPPDLAPLYDQATQQVAKLDAAKSLFKEQKYADAIASLQPLQAADPQNVSIQRIITDAHFNLGAQALQDERSDRTGDAIQEFDQVLKADPSDELAKRSRALAERYNGQPKDLLYKIYVKYLPLRRVS